MKARAQRAAGWGSLILLLLSLLVAGKRWSERPLVHQGWLVGGVARAAAAGAVLVAGALEHDDARPHHRCVPR